MNVLGVTIFCATLLVANGLNQFMSPKLHQTIENIKKPEQMNTNDRSYVVNQWDFEQRVDHFNTQDLRTFNQRGFEMDEFYVHGGPIIIVLGGIGVPLPTNISEITPEGILAEELANQTNAVLFAIENRYFGESRPTDDLSTNNLQYLTIDQSLSDYAVAIAEIRSVYDLFGRHKVVLSGFGTGAAMATWMRQKYPHLVDAVWSSSGPLQTKIEYHEYFTDIAATLATYGNESCYERIATAFQQIEELFESGNSSNLVEIFNLSGPIDVDNSQEVALFFSTIAHIFSIHIEYFNYNMLTASCNVIMDYEIEDDLDAFANFIRFAVFGEEIHVNYTDFIELYTNTSWDSLVGTYGNRAAFYYQCSQFSLFETSSGPDHPFGNRFPLGVFTQACRDIFGESFTEEVIIEKNNRVNIQFGGLNPGIDYGYFVNGEFDPFRHVGITQDLNLLSPADVVPLYGKYSDLLAIDENDSEDVLAVKERVFYLLDRVLNP